MPALDRIEVHALGFRVSGLGCFGVRGVGFRLMAFRFRRHSGFRVEGELFGVLGLRVRF